MTDIELEMSPDWRRLYLDRHDFYVREFKARVLAQFHDIDSEADHRGVEEHDRLAVAMDENGDPEHISHQAEMHAQAQWELLLNMRNQVLLAGLASLYHLWDKTLRDFIESEVKCHFSEANTIAIAWEPNIGKIFDVLKQFGWDCRSEPFFSFIDACRLVVNVYKHGKGRSLDELAANYPDYLQGPLVDIDEPGSVAGTPDYEMLIVTESKFDEIARALRGFWEAFPETLRLQTN